jgi:phage-related protein
MSIRLADLVAFISADTSGFDRELNNAEQQAGGFISRVGGGMTSMLGGAVVAGAAAAGAAVIGVGAASLDMAGQVNSATNGMINRLGLTTDEAESLQGAMLDIFGAGFGESIEDAGQSIEAVFNAAGGAARDLSEDQLANVTKQALAMRDVFGIDITESVRTASVMVTNGLAPSFEDAFDTIVTGFQTGANGAGDLLDTLTEYSDDLSDMGYTGAEALALINTGLANGAFNTDKLGDALNEFGVNLRDPAIRESIGEIDTGLLGIYDQFQAGQITEQEALQSMLMGLNNIDDAVARDQAGVLLFRSMWEDMGETAILSLADTSAAMEETGGAAESLTERQRSAGERMQAIWRQIQVALLPIGEELLNLVDMAMPYVEQGAAWLAERIPVFMETVKKNFESVRTFIVDTLWPAIEPFFKWFTEIALPALVEFIRDTVVPGVKNGFNTIKGIIEDVVNWVEIHIMPTVRRITDIVRQIFNAFTALFRGDFKQFGQYLRNAWDLLWSELRNLFDGVLRAIGEIDWGQLGQNIVDGLVNGIRNFGSRAVEAARTLGSNILDAARGFLGISSPSKVMAEMVGKPIAEGIAEGIDANLNSIKAVMNGAVNIPSPNGLQAAAAGVMGGGTNVGGITINFSGGAPSTSAEADDSARMLLEAMRKRGVSL